MCYYTIYQWSEILSHFYGIIAHFIDKQFAVFLPRNTEFQETKLEQSTTKYIF